MSGAINFMFADIYGTGWSTTEETIPEAKDQQAIVDDQKVSASVENENITAKKPRVLAAVVLFLILAAVMGGAK